MMRAALVTVFSYIVMFHQAAAYWLMGANNVITTQRIDPVVYPGVVSSHVHAVLGGSNFGLNVSTSSLRQSECTSIPIVEDKSNYWYPQLYFQWSNGTFTSVSGSAVIYYLFADAPGNTTAFPEDFKMVSGDPNLRTLNASSFAQQAVTFLCLDFNGKSSRYNELPSNRCPSGIRSQINFPSCWDGKNTDSPDHMSHVSFLSTGPDNGTCSDPNFPKTLPRIFLEVYWVTQFFDNFRNQAMTPKQPFVFANGDPTGYGYHADFANGWEAGILERAVDECNCNPYGDPTCCAAKQIFTIDQSKKCFISNTFDEITMGTLATLPGNNPVQDTCYEDFVDPVTPPVLSPVFVYNGTGLTPSGTVATPARTASVSQTAQGSCVRNAGFRSFRPLYSSGIVGIIFLAFGGSIMNLYI
ncbi:hypothetical protein BDQ12DRAFT_686546 [Crucibulum laeve]|uniref:DUF1996 domain-containing protein n=1 Tax=Crucibulum laeve TaxID=68775 RepID=A0A5C3LTS5_9AGAR|nr:hypothetical protein BDQ12DRAFT_686546 [Crucibulum laeve]